MHSLHEHNQRERICRNTHRHTRAPNLRTGVESTEQLDVRFVSEASRGLMVPIAVVKRCRGEQMLLQEGQEETVERSRKAGL